MLATTMPLVMLALWGAVARDAPVGRYGEPKFVAYFLATFVVRQLTGAWVFYAMNFEIRDGHPVHAPAPARPPARGLRGRGHRLDADARRSSSIPVAIVSPRRRGRRER